MIWGETPHGNSLWRCNPKVPQVNTTTTIMDVMMVVVVYYAIGWYGN